MKIRPPFNLPVIALILMSVVTGILFVSQNYVHFNYVRETAAANEKYLIRELEETIPPRLLYPMVTMDRTEIERAAQKIIRSEYVHSIQVLNAEGQLLTYQADNSQFESNEYSITQKSINIFDDRVVALDEMDVDSQNGRKHKLVGLAIVEITQHSWQQRTEIALFNHQIIFVLANAFVVTIFIFIFIFAKRHLGSRIEALRSVINGEFVSPKQSAFIEEIASLDSQINHVADAVLKSITELKATDAYKRTMLEFVSHELRQPLNVLGPMLNLLHDQVEKSSSSSKIKDMVSICLAASDQVIAVLDQLVDVTLMDTGDFVYHESTFSLEVLFDNLYSIYQQQNTKGLDFSISAIHGIAEDSASLVITDEAKLIRIFSNVLSNAFKFTERGSIHLNWKICHIDGYSFLDVTLRDTGLGFESENISKAFTTGFREHPSIEGKGIGLALVGSLVKFLSGTVTIDSKKNLGTRINIQIPLKTSLTVSEKPYIPPSLGMKAIVIDDNINNCLVLQLLLERHGVTATTFVSGVEAIKLLQDQDFRPDVVFVDYSMPGLSGTEVISLIKPFNLQVVCITAHIQPSVIQELNDLILNGEGLNYVLRKPIDEKELTKILIEVRQAKITIDDLMAKLKEQ